LKFKGRDIVASKWYPGRNVGEITVGIAKTTSPNLLSKGFLHQYKLMGQIAALMAALMLMARRQKVGIGFGLETGALASWATAPEGVIVTSAAWRGPATAGPLQVILSSV
jgi:hypothetical protein